MPEIAEVRVVRDVLKKQLLNKKITDIKILYGGIIDGDKKDFSTKIVGLSIVDITSRGKWLLFNLREYTLLSHLRMEGKYFYVSKDEPVLKHTHIIFSLDNGMELRYDDTRKFGRMQLVKTSEVEEVKCIKKLGYEPEDKRLTPEYLLNNFKNKKISIKSALLDQTIINGLGNIYANEVLFASAISPLRMTSTISKSEAFRIIENSSRIVNKSYEMGGCTIRSYTSSLGVKGEYQNELKVHGRTGKECLRCGNPIKKVKIDGRSAYYCAKCQK